MAKKSNKKPDGPSGLELLKQDVKANQYGRLYFFCGEEHFLRDYYLKVMKKKLLDGPAEEFNFHRLTQETMNLQALAEAVEAMPMMAEHTLIEVDDYDLSHLSEQDRETFIGIISDIPDYCTIVFVFDTVEYKVDGRLKKLDKALSQGLKVEFGRQSQRELTTWIRRHFKTHGKEIGDRQCELLTFLTGGAMNILGSEIEKIAAFAAGNEIMDSDIRAVVIPVLDAEVFDITDAITEGDYDKALQKLRTLVQMQEEPILLLAAIGSQMRRLLYAKVSMATGKGEAGLSELMKITLGRQPHPYLVQKTISAARRVSEDFCKRAVTLCMEADEELKGFSADNLRTLELLLIRLSQEAKRG